MPLLSLYGRLAKLSLLSMNRLLGLNVYFLPFTLSFCIALYVWKFKHNNLKY